MVLIDEFSTSTADSVPGNAEGRRPRGAVRHENQRRRRNQLQLRGRVVLGRHHRYDVGLQARKSKVGGFGYPYTEYIENVGIWPDIPDDYMTKANLLGNGAPFVSGFLQHMAFEIRAQK